MILSALVEAVNACNRRRGTRSTGWFAGNKAHAQILAMMKQKGWIDYEVTKGLSTHYRVSHSNIERIEFFGVPVSYPRARFRKVCANYLSSPYEDLIITTNQGMVSTKDGAGNGGIILGRVVLRTI